MSKFFSYLFVSDIYLIAAVIGRFFIPRRASKKTSGNYMKLAMIFCLVFLETMFVGSGIGVCLIIFALS